MASYIGKFDFLKLKNACVINVNGNTGAKKGVFIPIEDNNLFVKMDENDKPKYAYLDFIAFENKSPSRFGDTHMIKQSFSKDARLNMSEEEKRMIPILGNMKPYEFKNPSQSSEESASQPVKKEKDEPLPF